MAATQVCAMNSRPVTSSAPAIARPITRAPPFASSASIAMPSKPRNDSTATEVAASTSARPKVSGLYSGSHVHRPLPVAMAHAPKPRKMNSTISSPTSMIQVNRAVTLMPRVLTTVFAATNATSHTHTGTADSTATAARLACKATEATRYSSDGTRT